MPIALDATSVATPISSGTTLTWAHTVGTGADRLLHVSVGQRGNIAITGVTFNGVAMNLVQENLGNFSTLHTSSWRLVNPPSGTFNIVATFGAAIDIAGQGCGVSLTGVHQTTPVNGSNGTGDDAALTARNASITTTVNDCWLLASIKNGGSENVTPDGAAVEITDVVSSGPFAVSRLTGGAAGAHSMGWTWVTGTSGVLTAVAYAPSAGGGANTVAAGITTRIGF